MQINSTGITLSTLQDYLGYWTTKLQEKYGSDYVIKKEGVVANLATASSITNMSIEEALLYLSKQMNPYTAEGEWQDALYALIGLVRRYANFTVTQRTIVGIAGTVCEANSIVIQNASTNDQFYLNTEITIGEDGTAKGSFTAYEYGAIELEDNAILNIVSAPSAISSVYFATGDNTVVGDDYENDSEFRQRWLENQSIANSATEGGVYKQLLALVDNANDIYIRQNRATYTFADLPLHTMNVVIKSSFSDEAIAQTMFDYIIDGIDFAGTTTVTKYDSFGTPIDIKFTRAEGVNIYFKIDVALKQFYDLSQVSQAIKTAILNNLNVDMGQNIVANNFVQYINTLEGVDYIQDIKVSKNNSTWVSVIELNYNEFLQTKYNDITVNEA